MAELEYRVEPHGSCDVAASLNSQWRNGRHWHVIWPTGESWCYPSEEGARQRLRELEAYQRLAQVDDNWHKHHVWMTERLRRARRWIETCVDPIAVGPEVKQAMLDYLDGVRDVPDDISTLRLEP